MHHSKAIGEIKLELQSGNARFVSKSAIFCPVWPWNLMDDLENNRAPLLYCFKLRASFHTHQWIQSKFTVRKRSIRVKIDDFFTRDLQIWQMTLKNNGAPVQCYFKLSASFQSHQWIQTKVTVRTRSIRVKIGDFFVTCDLQIWQMTLKNKKAPLLCCFKLSESFHSHQCVQTKVTVRKRSIEVKIGDFCPVRLSNLTDDLEKQLITRWHK